MWRQRGQREAAAIGRSPRSVRRPSTLPCPRTGARVARQWVDPPCFLQEGRKMAIRTAWALALAGLAMAGCGGDGPNAKRFSGESKDVAAVVDRVQEYAHDGDAAKICDDLLTPQLARFIAKSFG